MAISGKSVKQSIPYIPEVERGNTTNPTVFFIVPKNILGTHKSLERFSKAQDTTGRRNSINPTKLFEADTKDFLEFCEKVENFMFPDEYPEFAKRGVATFSGDGELRLLMKVLDPNVFQEIQNASANWATLEEGKKAYDAYIAEKGQEKE